MNVHPITIHGVQCVLIGASDDYRVLRTDTGATLATACRRFLAIARAARLLHTPVRGAA